MSNKALVVIFLLISKIIALLGLLLIFLSLSLSYGGAVA